MNATEKALHQHALQIAGQYRRAEGELLAVLEKIDEKKVFRALGYSSLFQYAVTELKLSEGAAYNFITVARKARVIPEIKTEIQAGNLSVSTVRKIVPVIQPENAAQWIEKAKTLPRPQLEKAVATVMPQMLTPEKARYVTEHRIAVSLGFSETDFQQLKKIQDILSQQKRRAVSLEEAIVEMSKMFLENKDPVAKAERAVGKAERKMGADKLVGNEGRQAIKSDLLVHGRVASAKRYIPAVYRHRVTLRDGNQCTATLPSGERCQQKRWLDFHHIKPRSQGGAHAENNLQLLCFSHHRVRHS